MDLIIKNGRIVTHKRTFRSDIGIRNGRIVSLRRNIKDDSQTIVDAKGMLVLPGIIDAHVHFQLRTGGTVTSEDFASGTKAAACGGVTTVIDFAAQEKGKTLSQAISDRRREADGKAAIDYALHAVPTDWNDRTRDEIKKIAADGISSFKMYMIYAKAGLMSDDAAIFSGLEVTSKCSAMVTVHAESAKVLDLLIDRYHNNADMKRYGAYCHALSRPNFIEAEAVQRAVTWAEVTGGTLYIVHLSTAEGVDIIRRARLRGVKVYAETCPHYLIFDDSIFKRPDGHLYATCPQIKKKADQESLWRGLSEGTISVVATDNCAFTTLQKDRWKGDFSKIPYGLPGVETLLPLIHTFGVGKRRFSLKKMVRILCANPAKLMGLYPTKGTIAIGSDADLVIFNPHQQVTISHKQLQTKCDWSPYEGFNLKGYPALTISRGEIVARNGKFVGKIGHGRYLKRGEIGQPD